MHSGVIFIAFDSQVPESSIVIFSSWDLHSLHSKNSPVRNDSDLSSSGLDPFLGLFDPESVSMWPGIRVIVTRNLVKAEILTRITGLVDRDSGSKWPRNRYGPPWDKNPDQFWPGSFKSVVTTNKFTLLYNSQSRHIV